MEEEVLDGFMLIRPSTWIHISFSLNALVNMSARWPFVG